MADYFTREDPSGDTVLLRRTDTADERWTGEEWVPTDSIVDWTFGEDDTVDQTDLPHARAKYPDAFR